MQLSLRTAVEDNKLQALHRKRQFLLEAIRQGEGPRANSPSADSTHARRGPKCQRPQWLEGATITTVIDGVAQEAAKSTALPGLDG